MSVEISDETVAVLRAMGPPPKSVFTRLYESGHFFDDNGGAFAVADRYQISRGHMLVCPKRAVERLDQLTGSERNQLWALVIEVKRALVAEGLAPNPTGFRVMINEGAPQHIKHLHVHVIPWYEGMKP